MLYPAVVSPTGLAARILAAWAGDAFELVTADAILDELGHALLGGLPANEGALRESYDQLRATLLSAATVVKGPAEPRRLSRDPNDDYIAEVAILGRADLIVTNDGDLLTLGEVEGIPIVTLHAFALTLGLTH